MTGVYDALPPISQQIWDAKYRLKRPDGTVVDATIEDTWGRVARALAMAEKPDERLAWYQRFYDTMEGFKFIPAGRILAGAGTDRSVTLLNCFVMGTIPDSLDGIFSHLREAAITMQHGGGIGYDFSTLRPKGALVRGVEAEASGPLSFMDVWDAMCKTLMSAGYRRGAMMAVMDCRHPDLSDFIEAKRTIGRLTQFNMSVLVTDAFMEAVNENRSWEQYFPTTAETYAGASTTTAPPRMARDLWDAIMRSTYDHAEPGVIFIDRVNRLNNLWYCEHINCSNPCGEQMLPPYGSCDLGSINLAALVSNPFTPHAFIDANYFDWIVPLAIRMLDNVYDVTKFPLPQQAEEARLKRRLGLGVTGLANALTMCGLRYGTDEAVKQVHLWMSAIENRAYLASADLAEEKGTFPLFDRDKFLAGEHCRSLPTKVRQAIHDKGLRNSTMMSVAPTGTISLIAGNVSGGVEPPFANHYTRKVLQKDGSRTEEQVEDYAYALAKRLVQEAPVHLQSGLLTVLMRNMVTAQELTPIEHVRMLAHVQAYCDVSVSKTINLPVDIDFEDFKDVYRKAYDFGCKSCTTYRPNDVTGSVLSVDEPTAETVIDRAVRNSPPPLDDVGGVDAATFDEKDPDYPVVRPGESVDEWAERVGVSFGDNVPDSIAAAIEETARDHPEMFETEDHDEPDDLLPSRPDILSGHTHKIRWTDGQRDSAYYVTINRHVDGQPFEIFISSMNVEHQAWTTALTRMISAVFRRGGDVSFVAEELKQVVDPKGGAWIDGRYVPSLLTLLGEVIERDLSGLGQKTAQNVMEGVGRGWNEPSPQGASTTIDEKITAVNESFKQRPWRQCPKCGSFAVQVSEGCEGCLDCSWSKCG